MYKVRINQNLYKKKRLLLIPFSRATIFFSSCGIIPYNINDVKPSHMIFKSHDSMHLKIKITRELLNKIWKSNIRNGYMQSYTEKVIILCLSKYNTRHKIICKISDYYYIKYLSIHQCEGCWKCSCDEKKM